MYNSRIKITIPDALIPDTLPTGFTGTHVAFVKAHTTITQRGGVDFGQVSTDDRSIYSVTASSGAVGSITIYIDEMVKNGQVRIFYENIDVESITVDSNTPSDYAQVFAVQTITDENTSTNFANDPFASTKPTDVVEREKGKVRPVVGSGTVTITPESAQVNALPRPYTLTYKAPTKLPADAWLVVKLPTATDAENNTISAYVDNNRARAAVTKFTNKRVSDAVETVGEVTYPAGTLNPAYIKAPTGTLSPTNPAQTISNDSTFVSWKIGGPWQGCYFHENHQ